jgi:hypothetical protein
MIVLDLYSLEPVLGSESRFVRQAGVAFGRPRIGPVGDDELPALDQRRPDLTRWRHTALALPFDLQDLAVGRRYVEATVRMAFDDPKVRSLVLTRDQPAGLADDSVLDTWGVGLSELTWKLTAKNDQTGIRPSGRQVLAVLESPLASGRLTGTLDSSVRFTKTMLGVVSQVVAEPRKPLKFVLDVTDGEFEVATAQAES